MMGQVGLIFLILLSSCLLLASAGRRDRGERVRIRKKPKGGQCERIKEDMCIGVGLTYNRTRLPNVFGHNKQKLVSRALQDYRSVVESGCSPYIRAFLCISFLPECSRRKRQNPLQPCKVLCENARRDCEQTLNAHGLPWPDELGCEGLPEARPGDKREKCINFEPPKPDKDDIMNNDKPMIDTTSQAPSTTVRSVALPPVIDRSPQDSMIAEGQGSTLRCHAEGALEYTWSRVDGVMPEAKIASEMVVAGEAILVLHNLTTHDSGSYRCIAENEIGIVHATAEITVMAVPRISHISGNVTLSKGDPLQLTCQATGFPKPRVTWERQDGKRVLMRRNGTLAVLAVESASISDTGTYICRAANSLGSVTDAITVKVLVPPRWDEKPVSKSVNQGDDVILRCKPRGTEPLSITWRIENVNINAGTNRSMSLEDFPRFSVDDDKETFRIVNVQSEDKEFVYHCDVSNEAGAITASAKLAVVEQWQLPKISSPLPNTTAFVGEDVRMSCKTSGDPAPQVTWFLEEINIDMLMSDRFSISEKGDELAVKNVNLRDSGTYRCVAANVNGFKSVTGRLRVVEPNLKMTQSLANTTVEENTTLNLVCAASGDPTPEVIWFFNDRPINVTAEPTYVIYGGNLLVNVMTKQHEGKYGCMFSNDFFVVSSIAMVNISREVPTTPATDNNVLYNTTTSPNEVIVGPSMKPDAVSTACQQCQETQIAPSCADGQKADIKPRRYDITDAGLKGYFRGWVDVSGQGAANDYCRIVMTTTRGLDSSLQLACALAGTTGHNEYNYVSGEMFDVGQMDTWYMKDEDGDGKDDYCRCISEGPDGQYVYCTKADIGGFHGAPGVGETQYSFKAPGDRRVLRKCRKRKVDPFFGVASMLDN